MKRSPVTPHDEQVAKQVADLLDYTGRVAAGLQRGDWEWTSDKLDGLRYAAGMLGTLLYPAAGRPHVDPVKVRERALALLQPDRVQAITDYLTGKESSQ
ncbi:hypothetical protein [Streptosporangium sp. NPDC001681]|uniref:hypothetical protein n=1 Tax=Streptosporangium sp. NPDC001681 TaxID=3154395 RepID=UPI0033263BEC